MELDISGNIRTEFTLEHLNKALQSMNVGNEEFVILAKSDADFIQASGQNDAFLLEYKENPRMNILLRCTNQNLPFSVINHVFTAYFHNDNTWKNELEWEEFEF